MAMIPGIGLDVFAPPGDRGGRTVLVFVHGGGFVRGDKGGPDDPYYNNLGAWAASHGFIGVTMTYRLAPAARWPAGPQDISRALHWVRDGIAPFGGDPKRIVLMGQSAGAVHVAGYVAGQHGDPDAVPLAGAIMLSGLYDLTTLRHSDYERAYFGADAGRFGEQSTIDGLLRANVPTFYSVAELDPDNFQTQAAQLVAAHVDRHRVWPRMHYLDGQNHVSALYQLGLETDPLGSALSDFIKHVTGL